MKFWRKKTLLAKIEADYGVDPTPTGAANAILAANVSLRPLEGGEVNRETIQPYMGARGDILVDTHVGLDFEVEIAGGGAVDTPPGYGPLLRACGLAETITPTTGPVEYDPVSESFESVTIYVNYDGILHALLGARGTVGVTLGPSALPRYRFRMMGLFVAATDDALPAPDTSAYQTPLVASDANTPVFTLAGISAVLQELTLELGNTVEGRFLIGAESIIVSGREATGQAKIEMETLATKDFFALARARTKVAFSCQHGTVAGNIVVLDGPTCEVGRPSYEDSQGVVMLNVPLKLIPSAAGDDEFKITTK
jgi:hypothetical protein